MKLITNAAVFLTLWIPLNANATEYLFTCGEGGGGYNTHFDVSEDSTGYSVYAEGHGTLIHDATGRWNFRFTEPGMACDFTTNGAVYSAISCRKGDGISMTAIDLTLQQSQPDAPMAYYYNAHTSPTDGLGAISVVCTQIVR